MDILVALLDVLNLTLDGHLEKGETVFLQCTIIKTIDVLATRVPVSCLIMWHIFTDTRKVSGSWWRPVAN